MLSFFVLAIISLLSCEALTVHRNVFRKDIFDTAEKKTELEKRNVLLLANDFKCPSLFGAYPDPTDCSYFYVCVGGFSRRQKCPFFTNFDTITRRCISIMIATCDNSGKSTASTASSELTTKSTITEKPKEDKFTCPGMVGAYPHPTDCSKYYRCYFFVPTLKTCPTNELFDVGKKKCRSADKVDCGDRFETTAEPETTQAVTTLLPETTPVVTSLPPETTSEFKELTTETPEITTSEVSITPSRPTGPPDTDCDEDDVDCIITDTGEIPDWFDCPESVGSYPHPSSRKLFIFCLNWKPSVKKCGQDLIFDDHYGTCVSIDEADYANALMHLLGNFPLNFVELL